MRIRQDARERDAFTLLEISVVLVIIGLLVGGVLAGKSLIRSSQMRSVTTDFAMYKNAVTAFKEKYAWLPGDMPNAVGVWGAAAGATTDGVDGTCAALTTQSTNAATCNGDGNGFIADTPPSASQNQWYEGYHAWQQLGNAGLLNGGYGGVSGSGRTVFRGIPGTNIPASRIAEKAGWTFRSFTDTYAGDADWFATPAGNRLVIGGTANGGNALNGTDPAFAPEEAYRIDTKMDDGLAGTGMINTFKGSGTVNAGCTVDGTATTAYSLNNPRTLCALILRMEEPR